MMDATQSQLASLFDEARRHMLQRFHDLVSLGALSNEVAKSEIAATEAALSSILALGATDEA